MDTFDYATEAELFDYSTAANCSPPRAGNPGANRSATDDLRGVADALRFAIEDLPPELLLGSYLEVEDQRFDSHGMRRLYESPDYPLARRGAGSSR